MNVVVGDNTGLLKVVSLKTNGHTKRFGVQDASRGAIDAMAWAGLHNPESEVAVGLRCGRIEVWNTLAGELSAEIPAVEFNADMHEDKFVGIDILRNESARVLDPRSGPAASRVIVSATKAGTARIVPWYDAEQAAEIKQGLAAAKKAAIKPSVAATAAAKKSAATASTSSSASASASAASSYEYASGVEWNIGAEISKMRLSRSLDAFVAGGRNTLMSLWDLETQERVFKARSLPNDWLNMPVENHDLDYAFMPSAETGSWAPGTWQDEQTHAYKIATVTGYKQVRLYDCKASQRPVMEIALEKHTAHSVACSRDGVYVIVGDGVGRIQLHDTRFNLRQVGVLRGAQGSTRSLSVHHTLPMVASVGLDRYLRVHDLQTRALLKSVYLKQKLNCCLFSSVEPSKTKARSTVQVRDTTFDRNSGEENLAELDAGAGADGKSKSKSKGKGKGDGEEEADVWDELEQATKDRSKKTGGSSAAAAAAGAGAESDDDEEVENNDDDDELNFNINDEDDEDDDEELEQEFEMETVAVAKSKTKNQNKNAGSAAGASSGAVKRGSGGKVDATKKARR